MPPKKTFVTLQITFEVVSADQKAEPNSVVNRQRAADVATELYFSELHESITGTTGRVEEVLVLTKGSQDLIIENYERYGE